MITLGYVLLILGSVVVLAGNVMFLAVAYRHGLLWFLGCLFVPIVWFIFFLMNLRETARPFAIAMGGFLVACLGGWMAGIELS